MIRLCRCSCSSGLFDTSDQIVEDDLVVGDTGARLDLISGALEDVKVFELFQRAEYDMLWSVACEQESQSIVIIASGTC